MRDPQETSLELRVRASCCSMLGTAGAAPMLAWRARGHSRISCVLPSFHILRSTVLSTGSSRTLTNLLCCMDGTCSMHQAHLARTL